MHEYGKNCRNVVETITKGGRKLKRVNLIISAINGNYELKDCPLGWKEPLSCQMRGCPHWKGYMFKNAKYAGFKDYISSQWRKYMLNEVKNADYVMCSKEK